MQRLSGNYISVDGTKFVVDLSGNVLTLTIAGQPAYTLEPEISGRFVLKEVRIVSLEFVLDGGEKAAKVLIHQAGSVSEAKREQ